MADSPTPGPKARGKPAPVHDQPVGPDERGLVSDIGPVRVQWVRSIGYFGAVALAVALEVIEPPLGIFIAAVPFLKMLDRPRAPLPARMFAQLVDGAAQPVGGEAQGTITLKTAGVPGLPEAPPGRPSRRRTPGESRAAPRASSPRRTAAKLTAEC